MGLGFGLKHSDFQCTIFEDNTSCITMAESQKFTPRTKHISLKYHWFRSFTKGSNKMLDIKYVNTKEQTADLLTKPLDEKLFQYLRKKSNGWQPNYSITRECNIFLLTVLTVLISFKILFADLF